MSRAPTAVLVVVPARNEAARIGRCADARERAADSLHRAGWPCSVRVAVVLDSCTDATASVPRERPPPALAHWRTLTVLGAGPGAARALGVRSLVASLTPATPPQQVWVCTTDADSQVPPNWLTHQATIASQEWDAWTGTVEPDLDTPAARRGAWHRRHTLSTGHGYVFGASPGVRLSAYRAVGGFPAVENGEDIRLITALKAAGFRVRADDARVLTSGRLRARAVGGFGDYLRTLPPSPIPTTSDRPGQPVRRP